MYRKPKFLSVLHEIRQEMSREADYDVELLAQMARSGSRPAHGPAHNLRGMRVYAPPADEETAPQPPIAKAAKRINGLRKRS
jgi:hypothetical protein